MGTVAHYLSKAQWLLYLVMCLNTTRTLHVPTECIYVVYMMLTRKQCVSCVMHKLKPEV
jgi:hypothetical protein